MNQIILTDKIHFPANKYIYIFLFSEDHKLII